MHDQLIIVFRRLTLVRKNSAETPFQKERNMKYEIGIYWFFKAGGKRKALPLLKKFVPNDSKIFSRVAKETDHLGVFMETNNINDLDWDDGSGLKNEDAANEFDTYAIAGGEQYIHENFTETFNAKYVQAWFLKFKNHNHRESCRDKLVENINIGLEQGVKCAYSEDLFREIPMGIVKIGGDTIEEAMNRPTGVKVEKNVRSVVDALRTGPEHALFKLIR